MPPVVERRFWSGGDGEVPVEGNLPRWPPSEPCQVRGEVDEGARRRGVQDDGHGRGVVVGPHGGQQHLQRGADVARFDRVGQRGDGERGIAVGHNHAQTVVGRDSGGNGEGQLLQTVRDVGARFIQRFGQDAQSGDIAAVIVTSCMLRWAFPSADRACQGRAERVAVPGGGSRMRVRILPGMVPPLSNVRGRGHAWTTDPPR